MRPPGVFWSVVLIATAGKGLFQPGASFLHQLDPRVKVVATLILVILAFAAVTWGQIIVVTAVIVGAILTINPAFGTLGRTLWLLRWLLLFTFLLHLLFTPGRTLWGTSWLSYDGMLLGFFICVQLLQTVLLTAIMAMTTSNEDIVGAFGWMLSPLARIGVNTTEWEKMILLALNFIPVVYDQIEQTGDNRVVEEASGQPVVRTRWFHWAQMVQSFVLGLVERGDKVAHELAEEDNSQNPSEMLTPLIPLTLLDKLCVLSLIIVVFGYWFAGKFI